MDTLTATQPEVSSVIDLERDYLLQNYARYPIVLSRGKGPYVWDTNGKKYLDFISGIGVNALGHAHPRITKAISDQAGKLIHSSNLYYHEYPGSSRKAARRSERTAASVLQQLRYGVDGRRAEDGALAWNSHCRPEKFEIISLENSFHGRTMGALSITGQHKYRKDFEPLLARREIHPCQRCDRVSSRP